MIARQITEGDRDKWDGFCAAVGAAHGCLFRWQEALRSWGYAPVFLLAEDDDGEPCGCLPLCITPGVGARRGLGVHANWQPYGGPYATSAAAAKALLQQADSVFAEHRVAWAAVFPDPAQPGVSDVFEALRQAGYTCGQAGLADDDLKHVLRMPLSDWETVWKKVMGVKVRNQTRKATKKGVTVEEVDLHAFCPAYHDIQVEIWRRLGNPCPPPESLRRSLETMRDLARLYLARAEGQVVGALYCFYAAGGCFLRGAISRDEYRAYCVNNLMYSRSIEDACTAGAGFYDMGTTPPPSKSGHHHWKAQYGATPHPFLGYARVFRTLPYYVDRGLIRITRRFATRCSYGGKLAAALGPITRMIVNWHQR